MVKVAVVEGRRKASAPVTCTRTICPSTFTSGSPDLEESSDGLVLIMLPHAKQWLLRHERAFLLVSMLRRCAHLGTFARVQHDNLRPFGRKQGLSFGSDSGVLQFPEHIRVRKIALLAEQVGDDVAGIAIERKQRDRGCN